MTARLKFDQELEELSSELKRMSRLVDTALGKAIRSVRAGDAGGAAQVIAGDEAVDKAERDIESLCLKLILEQQPVATDLRVISAALKMTTDLERIGDQACDICEVIARLPETLRPSCIEHLTTMAETTARMVEHAIDAYADHDLPKAVAVHDEDDDVDALFDKVRLEIVEAVRNGQPDEEGALDLFLVAKYLERIGDHAENIAEWAEYSITGIYKGTRL